MSKTFVRNELSVRIELRENAWFQRFVCTRIIRDFNIKHVHEM